MTTVADSFAELVVVDGPVPTVAPRTTDELAAVMETASGRSQRVRVRGGGTHECFGYRIDTDVVVSTSRLDGIVEWTPDDLTVEVRGGTPVADLTAELATQAQTVVFPEHPGAATVGGVIAAAASPWRRLRYGPVRDRVLQTTVVTGDGRVVTAGGRVVKNSTGYDLPRLMAGSFGSLGIIVSTTLKLWPETEHRATVTVDDVEAAMRAAYRPQAVIETDATGAVYLAGTRQEIDAQHAAIGGDLADGHRWPEPLRGAFVLELRVPPRLVRDAVRRVPVGWRYQAAFGVGTLRLAREDGGDAIEADLASLRHWAETHGGSLVIVRAPGEFYARFDPWGRPPGSLELQRRVKAAFDPAGVLNPGLLPGPL